MLSSSLLERSRGDLFGPKQNLLATPPPPHSHNQTYSRCADGVCSNGVVGIDGTDDDGVTVCCPIGCGQCGGDGCDTSGEPEYGEESCCIPGVVNSTELCSSSETSPCVITGESYTTSDLVLFFSYRALTNVCQLWPEVGTLIFLRTRIQRPTIRMLRLCTDIDIRISVSRHVRAITSPPQMFCVRCVSVHLEVCALHLLKLAFKIIDRFGIWTVCATLEYPSQT